MDGIDIHSMASNFCVMSAQDMETFEQVSDINFNGNIVTSMSPAGDIPSVTLIRTHIVCCS